MPDSFEASLAPHDGDLLSLPFDQYGRMRLVQNILHLLFMELAPHLAGPDAPAAKLSVLDVGGYPGILHNFLSKEFYDLSVLDVPPDDGSIPGYRQGSGLELPYDDTSFDVAVSLDTLEHIPNVDRDKFLRELMRVARHGIVLVNPVQSIQADLAEETLNEYIRWILDAQQEQLAEHREYGLPNFIHTSSTFSTTGWKTLSFPIANTHNWLFMMVAKHYLVSMRNEPAAAFERTLDRFYNLTFSEGDRAEPGYRGVVIAVSPALEPVLASIQAAYPPVLSSEGANTQRLQLTQVLMEMLNLKLSNHEDRLLREQLELRNKHIAGMEQRVAVLDLQLAQREADNGTLSAHIDTLNTTVQNLNNTRESDNRALNAAREADNRALNAHIADITTALEEARAELERYKEHAHNLEIITSQIRETYQAEIDKQVAYAATLEEGARRKDEHILYLEKLLQGIASGRVMRLTRTVSRFLGRH
jgi:SAM-dependent methyltransferase